MSTIDRTAWLAERSTAIGASEVPSIFGEGFETPFQLWARKCGLIPGPDENEAMECGTLFQLPICELVRRRTGWKVTEAPQDVFLRSETHPFIGCTPDARAFDETRGDDALGILEIKNVGHYMGRNWTDAPPLGVQIQCQVQMFVTGLPWGAAAGLVGGNRLKWYVVERDERFIGRMVEACRGFWWRIQERIPPAVDGSDETRNVLHTIHPNDNGESVALGSEYDEYAAEIEALGRVIGDAEARKTELQNKIKAAIGDATFGELASGGRFSWKTQNQKEQYRPATTIRVLRHSKAKESK